MWKLAARTPSWMFRGLYEKGQANSRLFMPYLCILKLTWVIVGTEGWRDTVFTSFHPIIPFSLSTEPGD